MFRRLTIPFVLGAMLAGVASAHEFSMPAAVQADGAGHFEFTVTVEVTEPIEFGYAYLDGEDNTDLGSFIADGFCNAIMEPGTYLHPFEGNLIDPGQNGSVFFEFYLCDGWIGSGTTIVVAPTVATAAVSWSTIKAIHD